MKIPRRSGVRIAQDRAQKAERRTARDMAKGIAKTGDSYQNFLLNLGLGTNNALSASTYGFNPITRNRILLEWIHRGSWLGGVAVDVVADDMTRGGIDLLSTVKPDDIEKLGQDATTLDIWGQIGDVIRWGRLYGGACGVYLIDGQDLRTPLKADRIGKGQFKGIAVFDRWMVQPDLQNLVTDYGPNLGKPEYYRINGDAPTLRNKVVHHSRVFRVIGIGLPYNQRVMENLWGESVLERLYDRMVAFDSATTGAAQLVYKSHLRTLKIKGLRDLLATGGQAQNNVIRYVEMMRRFQGIEGITTIDGEDDFTVDGTNVQGGIAEALVQFGQQLAGALQIPLVRLFGQSPAGLNSSGESDLRTYYDGIKQQQERVLHVPVWTIYRLMALSAGVKLDDKFNFTFKPLWQMNEQQKSEVDSRDTSSVLDAYDRGAITQKTSLQELRQRGRETNKWQNITDEMIETADDTLEPPDAQELLPGDDPQPPSPTSPGEEDRTLAPRKQADDPVLDNRHRTNDGPNNVSNAGICHLGRGGAGGPAVCGNSRAHLTFSREKFNELPEESRCARCHEKAKKFQSKDSLPLSEVAGFGVAIEAAAGQWRWPGAKNLTVSYGYVRRVPSAEGKHEWMDAIVGPYPDSDRIWVMDKFEKNKFDEHKIVFGTRSLAEALTAYRAVYSEGVPKPSEVKPDRLREWFTLGDVTKPFGEQQ